MAVFLIVDIMYIIGIAYQALTSSPFQETIELCHSPATRQLELSLWDLERL